MLDVLILLVLLNMALDNAVTKAQVLGNSAMENSCTANCSIQQTDNV